MRWWRHPAPISGSWPTATPPLARQLGEQGVRGLELDLLPDPDGGRYAEPAIRRATGPGPADDPAWAQPGTKVLHVVDLDPATTCPLLVSCLAELVGWSVANPGHVPILVMLELTASDPRVVAAGGVASPPWDAARLDALDGEIRSIFAPEKLLTPMTPVDRV